MRALAVVLIVAGCDGIWDLEHIPEVDASTAPTGLVAWFPMESVVDRKVSEIVGARDGLCLDGQCPEVTPGRVGSALRFDGTMHVVNAPAASALSTKDSFSVVVWVRADAATTENACPVNKLYLGSETDNTWQLCMAGGFWRVYAEPIIVTGSAVEVGTWVHLAITWSTVTDELTIYQNGFAIGAPKTGELFFDDGRLVIGADVDVGGAVAYFPGAIDELQLYARALDPDEILRLADI